MFVDKFRDSYMIFTKEKINIRKNIYLHTNSTNCLVAPQNVYLFLRLLQVT